MVAFCDFRRKAQRASAAFIDRAKRVFNGRWRNLLHPIVQKCKTSDSLLSEVLHVHLDENLLNDILYIFIRVKVIEEFFLSLI